MLKVNGVKSLAASKAVIRGEPTPSEQGAALGWLQAPLRSAFRQPVSLVVRRLREA